MPGHEARRRRRTSARTTVLATIVLAILPLAGCGASAPRPVEGDPALSYADGLFLSVSGTGLAPADSRSAPPFAPAYATGFVAALASNGTRIAAAINRVGAVVLEPEERSRTIRVKEFPSPDFADRTVGAAFAELDGGFLFSLYRHPDEAGPDSGGSLLRLDASSGVWADEVLPSAIDAASVYALHRLEDGRFLVATRRTDGERIETSRWLVLPDGKVEPLSLTDFERMLAPRPARMAPPALRAALGSLAEETGGGRLLAFARNPGGDGTWYVLGDGAPETAVELVAALDASGAVAFAAYPEGPGKLASVTDGQVKVSDASLVAPVPGASWNGALIHGDRNHSLVLLLSWWVERFPDAAESGLLIRPLAGPGQASTL